MVGTIKARVGERIARALAEKDWSQAQLARALGVSENQVNRYLRGRHVPGYARLERIAELLEVPAEYLMYGWPDEGDGP